MNYKELMEKAVMLWEQSFVSLALFVMEKLVVTLYQDLALRVLEMLRCVTMMRGKYSCEYGYNYR